MRRNALLIAILALVVAGSASAAHPKPKLVRVVKHDSAFTATLTYVRHGGTFNLTPISHATLRIERNGHVVLQRKICQPYHSLLPRYRCEWGELFGLSARRVGPTDAPAFVVDFYTGGNTCCGVTFVALLGQHVVWIKHGWTWESAGFKRLRGRGAFVARDGRFYCAFSVCAGGSTPIQLWEINAAHKFVDVTRHFPWLIRKDATSLASGGGPHQTIRDQGSGVIAPWCADEYLLGHEARCSRVLTYAAKHHRRRMQGALVTRGLIRGLKRDLTRWGYKHRR